MLQPRLAPLLALALFLPAPATAQQAGSGTSIAMAGSGSSRGNGGSFVDEARARSAPCTRCGGKTYGTSVEWVNSVPEAARQAQASQKLVFVLHVSGHFETAGYT